MQPKKVNIKQLQGIIDMVKGSPDDAYGNYLLKNTRIQITKYQSTGSERAALLYKRRRTNGLCVKCGNKVSQKNPQTKKLYRLCQYHREAIDKSK